MANEVEDRQARGSEQTNGHKRGAIRLHTSFFLQEVSLKIQLARVFAPPEQANRVV